MQHDVCRLIKIVEVDQGFAGLGFDDQIGIDFLEAYVFALYLLFAGDGLAVNFEAEFGVGLDDVQGRALAGFAQPVDLL